MRRRRLLLLALAVALCQGALSAQYHCTDNERSVERLVGH
jgi:hypothetical protein